MWKAVKNYEGYYEVSDDGYIRSLDRYVTDSRGKSVGKRRLLKGAIKKQTKSTGRDGDGYYVVNLHKDGVSEVCFVHILVAQAFLQNSGNMPTVNHIDGNKHNNHASNLEWASFSENNLHAIKNDLRKPRGTPVNQFSSNGEYLCTYKSVCEASRITGISRGMINHCVNGRSSLAGGYYWEKVSESQTTIQQWSTREDELPVEAQRPLI